MADERSYATVTEAPDGRAPREQLDRLYTRYRFASQYCAGKDVLEAACGAGLGLGYLSRTARSVVGCDIDAENVATALRTYAGEPVKIDRADVHDLPYGDRSFDVVLLYEAIYYLDSPERFVSEVCRVLRDGGRLIICSANREWAGFNPSPFSKQYLSAGELYGLFDSKIFEAELMGYCPAEERGLMSRVSGALKRLAVRHKFMPKTMKGKEVFKRIFMGRLKPMPAVVHDGMGDYLKPEKVRPDRPDTGHKVIIAMARKRACKP